MFKSLVWLDPEKIPLQAGFEPGTFRTRGRCLTTRPTRQFVVRWKLATCAIISPKMANPRDLAWNAEGEALIWTEDNCRLKSKALYVTGPVETVLIMVWSVVPLVCHFYSAFLVSYCIHCISRAHTQMLSRNLLTVYNIVRLMWKCVKSASVCFHLMLGFVCFRVLDYDTYSAHDAIGKVYINLTPLLTNDLPYVISGWFPIYDTMHGGYVISDWFPVYDTMHGGYVISDWFPIYDTMHGGYVTMSTVAGFLSMILCMVGTKSVAGFLSMILCMVGMWSVAGFLSMILCMVGMTLCHQWLVSYLWYYAWWVRNQWLVSYLWYYAWWVCHQ